MYTIKEIAKAQNITLKDLAQQINVAPNTLSRIINGENTTVETLLRIAKVLNVDLRELFISNGTYGIIEHKGTTYKVSSLKELKILATTLK
ncbi:helix-turn-helix domain-containing protein [Maribacter sp. CXY002]|uniref:helix-turn-helix domain-containing protein n=1 Tax=Maribacter luteocoastalis TaxID=3407671 RepID=UPI003B679131